MTSLQRRHNVRRPAVTAVPYTAFEKNQFEKQLHSISGGVIEYTATLRQVKFNQNFFLVDILRLVFRCLPPPDNNSDCFPRKMATTHTSCCSRCSNAYNRWPSSRSISVFEIAQDLRHLNMIIYGCEGSTLGRPAPTLFHWAVFLPPAFIHQSNSLLTRERLTQARQTFILESLRQPVP